MSRLCCTMAALALAVSGYSVYERMVPPAPTHTLTAEYVRTHSWNNQEPWHEFTVMAVQSNSYTTRTEKITCVSLRTNAGQGSNNRIVILKPGEKYILRFKPDYLANRPLYGSCTVAEQEDPDLHWKPIQ